MTLCSTFLSPRVKQTLILTTSIALLTLSGVASATRVTLVATTGQQSVLSPASWAVFAVKDKERKQPVATLPRHSGTVILSPGHYRAQVKLDERIKETEFHVESEEDKVVSVEFE